MLRTVTELDIPQLCAIEIATQSAPWPRETFEKCFQAKCHGWVIAEPADKVIGFILVFIQVGECHILNLCVDPNQQRQGYGAQLVSQALTEAKQQGATIAFLEVRSSNENAIALYKKMGFTKIGERKGYYSAAEGREDAWVFVSQL
jgi:ribosomal-protein-alanine N-acetyltransferase